MDAILPAVLGASLVGSLHCAGMCGPLVAVVVSGGAGSPVAGKGASGARGESARRPGAARLLTAYHLTRGLGYVALGATAGAAGQLADLAGVLAGAQPLAATLAALTLLISGALILARHLGVRVPLARLPLPFASRLRRLQQRALRLPGAWRAGAIGASTALLPCGWLYAFATIAAGTGHPTSGALVMAAFWLGSVPILSFIGAGVRNAGSLLGPRFRPAFSAILIAVGVWALFDRSQLDSLGLVRHAEAAAVQAEAGTVPSASDPVPCCDVDEDPDGASANEARSEAPFDGR